MPLATRDVISYYCKNIYNQWYKDGMGMTVMTFAGGDANEMNWSAFMLAMDKLEAASAESIRINRTDNIWLTLSFIYDTGINWGRLLAGIYVCGEILKKCIMCNTPASDIWARLDVVERFFSVYLDEWINEQGGWKSRFASRIELVPVFNIHDFVTIATVAIAAFLSYF